MTTPAASYNRKSYQPYDGDLDPDRSRAALIARYELATMRAQKWVRRLVLVAALPPIVIIVRMYIEQVAAELGAPIRLGGDYFVELFESEMIFVALLMAAVGSSLIAKDTSSGAHSLYFSRPLNTRDYLLGKLLAVVGAMATVTLIPALFVAIAQFLVVPDHPVADLALSAARGLAWSALLAVSCGALILLMSAWGQRSRNIGLVWLAVFILGDIVRSAMVDNGFDSALAQLVSIRHLFIESGRVIFGQYGADSVALIAVVALTLTALVLLATRVRALERREA